MQVGRRIFRRWRRERSLADVLHETVDDEPPLRLELARPLGDLELQAATERQVDVEADDLGIVADPVRKPGIVIAERIDLHAIREIAQHAREQGIARLRPLENDGELTHIALGESDRVEAMPPSRFAACPPWRSSNPRVS